MLNLYTIRDKKADYYDKPWTARTDAEAVRSLAQLVNSGSDNALVKNPEDFSLHRIGQFDEQSGMLGNVTQDFIVELASLKKE